MNVSLVLPERLLQEMEAKARSPKIRKRIEVVRLATAGMTGKQISAIVGLSTRRVYNWVSRFNRDGLPGLGVKPCVPRFDGR